MNSGRFLLILKLSISFSEPKIMLEKLQISPRPTKGEGVVTTPLMVYLRPNKNAKESDPGHLGHLFYIICGHFDEKKMGIPP